ncbi:UvrB/UvrC motif-containing protein [Roseibacillus ishigakijimensis]|uniref:UvrB/UvrC motif-containing protein n=3 Tax=Roseibacillus ishigakijimensis TaxID=454146 RepID=A0A934RS07_9BACT|nr:UvrB/UvrC motif-containing protein [Roseibacillus ishigakijimensis]
MNKMSFCENCAIAKGIMDLSNFGLESAVVPSELPSKEEGQGGACPGCGFTLEGFQKTGRLGCSQCYLTFSDEILSRLGPMHRGLRHFGKHPEGYQGDAYSKRLLQESEERLAAAVEAENYEEAARIRDEIEQLKGGRKPTATGDSPGKKDH